MPKTETHPIRTARLRQKLSQAALGRRVGATKGAISKWESGLRHPRPATGRKLAAELKIKFEQVYAEAA